MGATVELDRVSADFGTFRAVDKVSVTIGAGEFFSFLGPSGCGKTTILRMVSGFISPSEGHIRIDGEDMEGIRPNKRPTVLIFQNLALVSHRLRRQRPGFVKAVAFFFVAACVHLHHIGFA